LDNEIDYDASIRRLSAYLVPPVDAASFLITTTAKLTKIDWILMWWMKCE
jgi:hypothetical protein